MTLPQVCVALALPWGRLRATIVSATYVVVAFSVLLQGLTLQRVARRFAP